ncbi:MAG: hypothetical protein K6G50_01900 [bacterium]|nr:hypothetical protein [bacterium]
MKYLTNIFKHNLGLKIVAFILAIISWIIVRVMASPMGEIPTQRVYTKPLVVVPPNNSELLASVQQKEITITLRGKRGVLERIAPSLISAEIDLSQRDTAGSSYEKVTVLAPGGAEVTETEPATVWVQVAKRQAAAVNVVAHLIGQPEEGYGVGKPVVYPAKLRVVGAQDDVDKIVAIRAPVSIVGADHTFSTRVKTLYAIDASGNSIENVDINSGFADVTVPILSVSQVKVDLSAITVNGAEGWTYDISANPSTVPIMADTTKELPASIPVAPFEFTHSAEPQSVPVNVRVPAGYTLAGKNYASVMVTVTPHEPKKKTTKKK